MKRCSKQILAAVMCAAVLTVSAPITAYADSTLDHLNGQYSELEKQQQALKDKLNQTKTEKEKQEAIRNNLNNQITNTQKQITLLDNKINYLQNDIADKEERINELSAEVLEQQDLFMKRIRSIYKTSVGTSMLGMVFGVDSLGSYLSYGKYLSRISEHDSALLQALADNITELRTLQAQMQEEKEDLADTKVTAESKKASLNSQKTEVESTLQDIKKMEQEVEYRRLQLRPQLLEDVKTAREFGDLSENFEYKAAKREKSRNDSRIRYLERMIKTAKVIDASSNPDEIGLFDKVTIYIEEDDEEQTIELVTTLRQNALKGLISKESPVGKAVMGHKKGDRVTVHVSETYSYDIVIRDVQKGSDDESLPISSY